MKRISKTLLIAAFMICGMASLSRAQTTKADVEQLFELSGKSMADIKEVYIDDKPKSHPAVTLSESGIFVKTDYRVTFFPYRNIKSMFIQDKDFYVYLNQ